MVASLQSACCGAACSLICCGDACSLIYNKALLLAKLLLHDEHGLKLSAPPVWDRQYSQRDQRWRIASDKHNYMFVVAACFGPVRPVKQCETRSGALSCFTAAQSCFKRSHQCCCVRSMHLQVQCSHDRECRALKFSHGWLVRLHGRKQHLSSYVQH